MWENDEKQRQWVDVGWLQLNEEYLPSSNFYTMFQSDKVSDADMTSLAIQHFIIIIIFDQN